MIEKIYPNLTLLEGTPINLQSDKKDLVNRYNFTHFNFEI